ncbi:conjugal transfer protein TraX [bacterium]|nr:conjugal transfer protein TraX [bacterium]MDD6046145.1 TraX family protein [bacterium]
MPQYRIRDKIQLTQTQLKLIAALFMTSGSIALYGFEAGAVAQNYSVFSALGWVSAPIFLYCLLESLRYTSSRPKLLLRLYAANILFSLLRILLNLLAQPLFGFTSVPNAFAALFFIAASITLIDMLCKAIQRKNRKAFLQAGAAIFAVALWCVVEPHIASRIFSATGNPEAGTNAVNMLRALLPSLIWLDYTVPLIGFGILWYFIRSRKWQIVAFACFCFVLIICCIAGVPELRHMRFMVFALPLLLLYNGKRGRGFKYFFYLYYPAHILLIQLAAGLIS